MCLPRARTLRPRVGSSRAACCAIAMSAASCRIVAHPSSGATPTGSITRAVFLKQLWIDRLGELSELIRDYRRGLVPCCSDHLRAHHHRPTRVAYLTAHLSRPHPRSLCCGTTLMRRLVTIPSYVLRAARARVGAALGAGGGVCRSSASQRRRALRSGVSRRVPGLRLAGLLVCALPGGAAVAAGHRAVEKAALPAP